MRNAVVEQAVSRPYHAILSAKVCSSGIVDFDVNA